MRGTQQMEARYLYVERRPVLINHAIAPAHCSSGRVKRTARHVVEAAARRDQGHLPDHAFAMNLVKRPPAVGDRPAAREQLHGTVGAVLDSNVIGPEPATGRRVRLLGKIADRDADGNVACNRNVWKQHCERVGRSHESTLGQCAIPDNG